MRKNLKNILLLITIMAAVCLFTGCVAVGQNDSPLLSGQGNLPAKQSADTLDSRSEESLDGKKQNDSTKEEQQGAEQSHQDASAQSVDAAADRTTGNNASADEGTNKPVDEPTGGASDEPLNGSAELYVHVESIGDNSVVGSKISVEPVADSSSVIMVSGGGDDEVMIPIHFEENTSYIYQIIKNDGADVETREGSFSDIGLNMILDLTGHYEGDDFYANKVVISNVILN